MGTVNQKVKQGQAQKTTTRGNLFIVRAPDDVMLLDEMAPRELHIYLTMRRLADGHDTGPYAGALRIPPKDGQPEHWLSAKEICSRAHRSLHTFRRSTPQLLAEGWITRKRVMGEQIIKGRRRMVCVAMHYFAHRVQAGVVPPSELEKPSKSQEIFNSASSGTVPTMAPEDSSTPKPYAPTALGLDLAVDLPCEVAVGDISKSTSEPTAKPSEIPETEIVICTQCGAYFEWQVEDPDHCQEVDSYPPDYCRSCATGCDHIYLAELGAEQAQAIVASMQAG